MVTQAGFNAAKQNVKDQNNEIGSALIKVMAKGMKL
jgi:hypothetical protein